MIHTGTSCSIEECSDDSKHLLYCVRVSVPHCNSEELTSILIICFTVTEKGTSCARDCQKNKHG